MQTQHILITGGTGFIGSRLALKCSDLGYRVTVFGQANTLSEERNRYEIRQRGITVIDGSVMDSGALEAAAQGVDVVVHLAAAQHEANITDQIFYNVNVTGTENVLHAAHSAGVKRFVHGSTIGVYGNMAGMIDEMTPCNPDNIYGRTKLAGEGKVLSHQDELTVVIIRIPETYGPGDNRLLKLFKAINKKLFFMIGPGENLHHLIYIDDLLEGFLQAAFKDLASGTLVVLAGKEPVTTNAMVSCIARELHVAPPKLRAPLCLFMLVAVLMEKVLRPFGIQPPLHRRRMDFFKKSFSFSTDRARKLLGFEPQYTFAQGVAETAKWYHMQGYLQVSAFKSEDVHESVAVKKIDPYTTAKMEPFDSFWEAPSDVEKGYSSFVQFYRVNYLKHLPRDKKTKTLVISCGPGYFVHLLRQEGYTDVHGIDSDPEKVRFAERRGLNCHVARAFEFLRETEKRYDLIIAEQEINHLTKDEILVFMELCREKLQAGGMLVIHSLNGANPITGSEALAQNFDHYNTFTEYSMKQMLLYTGFTDITVFPLQLFVFYKNPFNYVGLAFDWLLNWLFRIGFLFYGKKNRYFSKKIAAICRR
jgi:nucleoside-diphosphate-sugar epimerase/2-polyprenyl-3-methyl-5-hydroxy-6-metoxy-1,4-benzoquinol methylase